MRPFSLGACGLAPDTDEGGEHDADWRENENGVDAP
jgi:hypothetical protein